MASCLLYHGPGAREAALARANAVGRLLAPPFGEEGVMGLKVDEARAAVALMQASPVGDQVGVIVIGPMDQAAPKSADTLLKSIEEVPPYVHPILWARDIGGVQPTIRSRCLDIWAPPTGRETEDELLVGTARELIRAHMASSLWEIPQLVKKLAGRETELLGEVAEALVPHLADPRHRQLWERLRQVAVWRNPQQVEVIAAFLPGGP